jgi:putative FmdB family regulatory protein
MPIYEYKCLDCGTHLEKMQKVSDAAPTVCENCGGKLEKQWSRSGFQFKGEGWYVTDYAGKKNGAPEKSPEKSSEKTSAGESTAKTEPASKDKSGSSAKDTSSKKD